MSEKLILELFHLETTPRSRNFARFIKFWRKLARENKFDVGDMLGFLAWEIYRMQICIEGIIEDLEPR